MQQNGRRSKVYKYLLNLISVTLFVIYILSICCLILVWKHLFLIF